MKEIKTKDYTICYDPTTTTVSYYGSLRLIGIEEYGSIVQLLDNLADQKPPAITLNFRELEFLNSSGINIISKFVIKVRQEETIQLIIQGSQSIAWQGKSLRNLQRLMPSLRLELA